MSQVAEFRKLSPSALGELAAAAVPRRRLFGRAPDEFLGLLAARSTEVATYPWSGIGLIDTLVFLEEHGINLLDPGELEEELGAILDGRQLSGTVLTPAHRSAYLGRLTSAGFTSDQFAVWHRDFSETEDPDAPRMMADAVAALVSSLQSIDDDSVVLVTVD